jgi:hypothetical protein
MKTNQTLSKNFFDNLLDQYMNLVLVKKSHKQSGQDYSINNSLKHVSGLNVA